MNSRDPRAIAMSNLSRLAGNVYPGRGIMLGTSQDGLYAVQVYWIGGRSPNSQNRVFGVRGGRLFTEAADPTKVKDPKLIIYNAMCEGDGAFVVSNGDQTDTAIQAFGLHQIGLTLSEALCGREYEPDEPNWTPRITGLHCVNDQGKWFAELSILRKSVMEGSSCERFYYEYGQIASGYGFCIHTYGGDGEPLPAFAGEPYLVSLEGNIEDIARDTWALLNEKTRVALAVKFINLKTEDSEIEIINRFTKVG
jgi:IMP cyclohydrolase